MEENRDSIPMNSNKSSARKAIQTEKIKDGDGSGQMKMRIVKYNNKSIDTNTVPEK